MKVGANRLRTGLYLAIAAGFVVLGLMPLQTKYAQSLTIHHETCGIDGNVSDCIIPHTDTTVVLKDKQRAPFRHLNKQPEPLPQAYYAQLDGYPDPKKPSRINLMGSLVLRPPDLVMLYANYRI